MKAILKMAVDFGCVCNACLFKQRHLWNFSASIDGSGWTDYVLRLPVRECVGPCVVKSLQSVLLS